MSKLSKFFVFFGVFLVVLSLCLTITSVVLTKTSQAKAEKIIAQVEELFETKVEGVNDDYSSMEMPALEIENQDVVGVVEIPRFDLKLPVCNDFGFLKVQSFPRVMLGSVYDNSLVVIASDKQSQFSCVNSLEIGEKVNVVDMTGAEFSYEINDIFRSKSATNSLTTESDFTLVIKQEHSFEYVIVCCTKI